MRVVIQRVTKASVTINNSEVRTIGHGLVVLAGIEEQDDAIDATWLAEKIAKLRIFNDAEGVMNLSVCDVHGEVMIISQFTLHAMTKKGNRPSYIRAARPEKAVPIYIKFISEVELQTGKKAVTGEFGAYMKVQLVNDGPVTIIIDSKQKE